MVDEAGKELSGPHDSAGNPLTFNRHFKQVTSLSPLQFQKRLRLYEAERLMLLEGTDASTAALMLDYESGSQINKLTHPVILQSR